MANNVFKIDHGVNVLGNSEFSNNMTIGGDLTVIGNFSAGSAVGYTGSRGYTGSIGFTGSTGSGFTGSASTVAGFTGSTGSGFTGSASTVAGFTGSVGVGFTGSASTVIGYSGSLGYSGSIGFTGSRGYSGSAGYDGSKGYTGSLGYVGSQGDKPGLKYQFDSTSTNTTIDPGSGIFRFNNSVIGSVTEIAFSTTKYPSGLVDGYLDTWDDSTNPNKGQLHIYDQNNNITLSAIFNITAVTVGTNVRRITVQNISGTIPDNAGIYSIQFFRTGDVGYAGSSGYTGSASTVIGYSGSKGFDGSRGYSGSVGYDGSRGYTGSASTVIGYTGSASTIGGYTGSSGGSGFTGSVGYTGSASTAAGYTGSVGYKGGYPFLFSTDTSDTDPGVGYIKFNNAITSSVSVIYIDIAKYPSGSLSATIQDWDTSNNPTKGIISVISESTGDVITYNVSGSVTNGGTLNDQTGWRKFPVTFIGGTTLPSNNSLCSVQFARTGNLGYTGSTGSGYTGSASVVIGYTGSASTVIGYTGSVGVGYTGSASTVIGYTGSKGYDGSRGYTGSASTVIGYTGSVGVGYTGSASTVIGYTGSVGVGYTGSASTVIGYSGSVGYTGSGYGTTASVQMGSLGVGTPASGTSGEIRATNNITAYYSSDRRLKTNITPIKNALDKIKKINGVMFEWTDDYINRSGGEDGYFVRKQDTGVIAQEIEKVLPEVVALRPDGYKAVKYDRIISLIIEAVKELADKVEKIEEK